MYIWIILMLAGVFLDQISKYLIVMYLGLEESVDIIPGVFRFTYIRNEGAAFGSMADSRWVFMVVSCIMIIGIFVYIFWKRPQSKLLMSALTLIVAGGIGNMIDRVRLGYVIDFLDFCAFPNLWMWTFNVADSFVCIGAGLMILWMILDMIREQKAEKLKKAEALAASEQILAEQSDAAAQTEQISEAEQSRDGELTGPCSEEENDNDEHQ